MIFTTTMFSHFTQEASMAFSEEEKLEVWKKGDVVSGVDSAVWRKDQCGAWINFAKYGERNSDYGWEVDHIKPVSKDGGDNLGNLRPLHWKNNAAKSDGRLSCAITSDGNKNVAK